MNVTQATKERIAELANKKGINFCRLATVSGIPYTTLKSIIYSQSNNPGIATIKKICDGLEISITDFFNTETFKNLEQEIQ
ncbi:MAG: helix-turn-helix transcriptional regulator [Clostridia bacterium]|nr:helix-turn-helix transcriptional regulator [Clostridia bacterium]